MSHRFLMSALRGLFALLLATTAAAALAQSEQQKLVNAADATFQKFGMPKKARWSASS